MIFNVRRWSTAAMPVDFYDVDGEITTPSSATLTITYTTTASVLTSTVIAMVPSGASFIGSWGAGVSDLGIANYSVSAPGQTNATIGQIRVLSSHV